jgi:hypothetical protein
MKRRSVIPESHLDIPMPPIKPPKVTIPMLGHNVTVKLTAPNESIYGELRRQTPEGIWLYTGDWQNVKLIFYPQHRILQITDNGKVR